MIEPEYPTDSEMREHFQEMEKMGLVYEDDLPEMTDAEYSEWYAKSEVVFGVRMGPPFKREVPMAELECAAYLFFFIFTGLAFICFDPQTRFPDEGEPDLWYEGQMRQVHNMHLLPSRHVSMTPPPRPEWQDAILYKGVYSDSAAPKIGRVYLSISDPDFAAKWMDQSLGFGIKCFNAPHTEFEDGNGY